MPVYAGAIGVELAYEVIDDAGAIVDISTATAMKFKLRKPNNTTLNLTPHFETDGTNGVLIYITTSDELDKAGTYRLQPSFKLGLFDGPIAPAKFVVGRNVIG